MASGGWRRSPGKLGLFNSVGGRALCAYHRPRKQGLIFSEEHAGAESSRARIRGISRSTRFTCLFPSAREMDVIFISFVQ